MSDLDSKGVEVELARLQGSLQSLADSIHTRHEQDTSLHSDHEVRLRALERWRYAIPSTLVLALASIVITILVHR